jgi:surfeit locus 1 family protein
MTQSPIATLPRLLFTRRWRLATLLVLLGIAFLIRLGLWQLDRREQRQAQNTALAAQLAQPPIPLTGPSSLPADPTTLRDRQATATGRYDFSHQFALTQQVWQDTAGFRLITPLVLEDGRHAILVDRGWLPADLESPDQWAQFDEPGQLTVQGYIQPSQPPPNNSATTTSPAEPQQSWYRLDIPAIQSQMPYELLLVYLQAAGDDSQLPYRAAPVPDLSEGPHLSYAIQWFLFALILTLAYLAYVHQHTKT